MPRNKNRIRPADDLTIRTRTEADEVLRQRNEAIQKIEALDIEYKTEAEELKAKYNKAKLPFEEERNSLQNAIAVFVNELLPQISPAKSIKLNHGTIGARRSTKISIKGKETEGYTFDKVIELNLTDYIKTIRKINKSALHTAPPATLKLIGAKRIIKDEIFIDPPESLVDTTE